MRLFRDVFTTRRHSEVTLLLADVFTIATAVTFAAGCWSPERSWDELFYVGIWAVIPRGLCPLLLDLPGLPGGEVGGGFRFLDHGRTDDLIAVGETGPMNHASVHGIAVRQHRAVPEICRSDRRHAGQVIPGEQWPANALSAHSHYLDRVFPPGEPILISMRRMESIEQHVPAFTGCVRHRRFVSLAEIPHVHEYLSRAWIGPTLAESQCCPVEDGTHL